MPCSFLRLFGTFPACDQSETGGYSQVLEDLHFTSLYHIPQGQSSASSFLQTLIINSLSTSVIASIIMRTMILERLPGPTDPDQTLQVAGLAVHAKIPMLLLLLFESLEEHSSLNSLLCRSSEAKYGFRVAQIFIISP